MCIFWGSWFLSIDVNPMADEVQCTDIELNVSFADGRRISVFLAWFPLLANATPAESNSQADLGDGQGIPTKILVLIDSLKVLGSTDNQA